MRLTLDYGSNHFQIPRQGLKTRLTPADSLFPYPHSNRGLGVSLTILELLGHKHKRGQRTLAIFVNNIFTNWDRFAKFAKIFLAK